MHGADLSHSPSVHAHKSSMCTSTYAVWASHAVNGPGRCATAHTRCHCTFLAAVVNVTRMVVAQNPIDSLITNTQWARHTIHWSTRQPPRSAVISLSKSARRLHSVKKCGPSVKPDSDCGISSLPGWDRYSLAASVAAGMTGSAVIADTDSAPSSTAPGVAVAAIAGAVGDSVVAAEVGGPDL